MMKYNETIQGLDANKEGGIIYLSMMYLSVCARRREVIFDYYGTEFSKRIFLIKFTHFLPKFNLLIPAIKMIHRLYCSNKNDSDYRELHSIK